MGIKQTKTTTLATALNFELGDGNHLPEWLEIIPAKSFKGVDSRWWKSSNPQDVIDRTLDRGFDLVVDIEHATQHRATEGKSAPAQAWIKSTAENFEIRDGAIFGRVDWNKNGKALVENKEYRYYSPVFDYDIKTNEVDFIRTLGLTNTPNLTLTALNQEETFTMKLSEAIAAALGLGKDATEQDAVTAINKIKSDKATAENQAQTPSLEKFVPRSDYDTAMNTANSLQAKLDERDKSELTTAINTEIDAAIKAGKIAPASKEYHTASCQQEGGLDRFKKFAETAPVIVGASDLDGKELGKTSTALNTAEQDAAKALGWTNKEFLDAKNDTEKK